MKPLKFHPYSLLFVGVCCSSLRLSKRTGPDTPQRGKGFILFPFFPIMILRSSYSFCILKQKACMIPIVLHVKIKANAWVNILWRAKIRLKKILLYIKNVTSLVLIVGLNSWKLKKNEGLDLSVWSPNLFII